MSARTPSLPNTTPTVAVEAAVATVAAAQQRNKQRAGEWIAVFVLLILVWLAVSFWRSALYNLFFRTFKWNPHSTALTIGVAVIFTLLLALGTWLLRNSLEANNGQPSAPQPQIAGVAADRSQVGAALINELVSVARGGQGIFESGFL